MGVHGAELMAMRASALTDSWLPDGSHNNSQADTPARLRRARQPRVAALAKYRPLDGNRGGTAAPQRGGQHHLATLQSQCSAGSTLLLEHTSYFDSNEVQNFSSYRQHPELEQYDFSYAYDDQRRP